MFDGDARPYWPPLVAGIALGLTLLLTFIITGHGLGASGFFTRVSVVAADWLVPGWAQNNDYFGLFLQGGANPLLAWITWEVVGVFVGGLAATLMAGRFRPQIERGGGIGRSKRLGYAFAGGVLTGFGARLARGCTSGLGLSGGGTLAVAGFVFLIGFFVAGFGVSYLMRRAWQ